MESDKFTMIKVDDILKMMENVKSHIDNQVYSLLNKKLT